MEVMHSACAAVMQLAYFPIGSRTPHVAEEPGKVKMANKQVELKPGQRGTYAGFTAVFVRYYAGNMIELRVPGGLTCVDARHFIVGSL